MHQEHLQTEPQSCCINSNRRTKMPGPSDRKMEGKSFIPCNQNRPRASCAMLIATQNRKRLVFVHFHELNFYIRLMKTPDGQIVAIN